MSLVFFGYSCLLGVASINTPILALLPLDSASWGLVAIAHRELILFLIARFVVFFVLGTVYPVGGQCRHYSSYFFFRQSCSIRRVGVSITSFFFQLNSTPNNFSWFPLLLELNLSFCASFHFVHCFICGGNPNQVVNVGPDDHNRVLRRHYALL